MVLWTRHEVREVAVMMKLQQWVLKVVAAVELQRFATAPARLHSSSGGQSMRWDHCVSCSLFYLMALSSGFWPSSGLACSNRPASWYPFYYLQTAVYCLQIEVFQGSGPRDVALPALPASVMVRIQFVLS
jgi:hypothetical protein